MEYGKRTEQIRAAQRIAFCVSGVFDQLTERARGSTTASIEEFLIGLEFCRHESDGRQLGDKQGLPVRQLVALGNGRGGLSLSSQQNQTVD